MSGGEVGGGGGGSSLIPAGGALTLAPLTTPPSVVITTGPPRKTAAVAITRIRATPVSPGCATETGTKERETRAGTADATCRHFRLTVRGAIRVGGRLAPTASGRVAVTATAMLPRGETMRAAPGSVTRGGWRVSLILSDHRPILRRRHHQASQCRASHPHRKRARRTLIDASPHAPSASHRNRLPHGLTGQACLVGGCRKERRFGLKPPPSCQRVKTHLRSLHGRRRLRTLLLVARPPVVVSRVGERWLQS